MAPPLVSFVTWNRLGLNVRNLSALLETPCDFELHIIDSNSNDGTWEFIQHLTDSRIASKTLLDANRGPVYASKGHYFIKVDNDVHILTPAWAEEFLKAFEAFPDVGLLGAVTKEYYDRYRQPLIQHEKGGVAYLQLHKGFVEGCCQCLRPELLEMLGYWSEENCMGDAEICQRIQNYTPYNAGFLPAVSIDQAQYIPCAECKGKKWCKLAECGKTCFDHRQEKYRNPQFRTKYGWKWLKNMEEMNKGNRAAYCGSVHDEASIVRCSYNRLMASENFRYYEDNAN